MDEHNAHVKSVTPPRDYYTMELSEGWTPLCKMLGVPEPDEPFPRANDAEAVDGLASRILAEAAVIWGAILAGVGVVAYGTWRTWAAGMLPLPVLGTK